LAGLDDCIDCEVPESARPTDAAEAAMAESA
jgi:glutathione-regulated potassium-efflux system ancillary protein KefF